MKTRGFDELAKKLEALKNLDLVAICEAGAYAALAEMNKEGVCPVESGAMRASSQKSVEPLGDNGAQFGYLTDYAFYVARKNNWIDRTLDEKHDEIAAVMGEEAKKQINSIGGT